MSLNNAHPQSIQALRGKPGIFRLRFLDDDKREYDIDLDIAHMVGLSDMIGNLFDWLMLQPDDTFEDAALKRGVHVSTALKDFRETYGTRTLSKLDKDMTLARVAAKFNLTISEVAEFFINY